MPSTHFDLVSHWRIPAPVERVWAALSNPEGWPQWWHFVRRVETLQPGDTSGVGSARRIRWAARLPYDIVIEVETLEVLRHERLRARACGQLQGEGIWLLRAAGDATHVTYVWRVAVAKPWMRWLAPVMSPVFRWNHDAVMKAGEAGLTRHLLGPVSAPGLQDAQAMHPPANALRS